MRLSKVKGIAAWALFGAMAVLGVFGSAGCSARDTEQVEPGLMIHAAASLEDVIRALGDTFERETGIALNYNFGGSSSIAQQIVKGGARGIYISADEAWANYVAEGTEAGWVTQDALFGNTLSVVVSAGSEIVPVDNAAALATLPAQFWVLADPLSVPAGRYARDWMESVHLGGSETLWDAVSPKVAPAVNVRAAVAQIRRVPESIGVIYGSDLSVFRDTLIEVYRPSPEHISDIQYHAVCLAESEGALELYQGFLNHLHSEDAQRVLESYGFVPKPDMRH